MLKMNKRVIRHFSGSFETFYAKDLQIRAKAVPTPLKHDAVKYGFGEVISDHMCEIIWDN